MLLLILQRKGWWNMLQSKLYITCYNLAHFESFRKSEQLRCFFYTCLVKIKKNIFLILHCTENTGANIARYVFCQMFREHYMSRACAYNKRQQWHMVLYKQSRVIFNRYTLLFDFLIWRFHLQHNHYNYMISK